MTSNPALLMTPVEVTALLRQIPIASRFIFPSLVRREQIRGNKWKARSKEVHSVMAAMVDVAAHLPKGLKGNLTQIEGEMLKIGLSLDIDPSEIIAHSQAGTLQAHLLENSESLLTSIFSTYEWLVLRGIAQQSVSLSGGASQVMGTIGDTMAAAVDWQTAATATGIVDLVNANELMKALPGNNGFGASRILMSNNRWVQLRNQASTQQLVHGVIAMTTGKQVTNQQLRDLILANDLPPVQIYDAEVEVLSGNSYVATRVLPEDIVLLLPPLERFPGSFGFIFEGETSDQIMQVNKGRVPSSLGGGIYGFIQEEENPGRMTQVAQVASGIDVFEACSKTVGIDVDGTNGFAW